MTEAHAPDRNLALELARVTEAAAMAAARWVGRGDKNGADINLALDALEMAFTHPHINAYVIVGGDSEGRKKSPEDVKAFLKKVFSL